MRIALLNLEHSNSSLKGRSLFSCKSAFAYDTASSMTISWERLVSLLAFPTLKIEVQRP